MRAGQEGGEGAEWALFPFLTHFCCPHHQSLPLPTGVAAGPSTGINPNHRRHPPRPLGPLPPTSWPLPAAA